MHASRFALTFSMWLRVSAGALPSPYARRSAHSNTASSSESRQTQSIIACLSDRSDLSLARRRALKGVEPT
jgi:hypothetical protein